MQHTNFLSGVINFNRSIFTNAFDATAQLQNHAIDAGKQVMDQLGVVPEQTCHAYDNAAEAFSAARSNFKAFIDESFDKTDTFFSKSA